MKWLRIIQNNIITWSIYFILFFIAVNGLLDYYFRIQQQKYQATTALNIAVEESMTQILRTLNLVDLGFRGYYIIPNEQMLDPFFQAQKLFPEEAKKLESQLKSQGLSTKEFAPVKIAFNDYFALMEKLVEWREEGNIEAINEVIAGDPGYKVWQQYDKFNQGLQQKQSAIVTESERTHDQVIFYSTLIRISLLAFGIPTLVIVLIRLSREKVRRQNLFTELEKSNKKYLFDPKEKEQEEMDEQKVISSLISNLKKTAGFISSITSGNFGAEWTGLNVHNREANKESVAGELEKMRDQLLKLKQEDEVRLWVTEGISKFAEIVRQHQDDMGVLSDKLMSNIVKYLGANQASLFFSFANDDKEIVLKLYGCYAYDRKKYLEKTILPGQGLVGQTYLEKSVNHITEVPQHYVHITSGLGEATATNLLLVPLKFNERVEGVIEIASFKPFKQYEIDFLEKVGEIIASAVVSLRDSMKMKELMETMQVQSEEMKAQEEEMRQNMEELQATQEEVSRKIHEYQAVLAEKDAEIERMRQENTAS